MQFVVSTRFFVWSSVSLWYYLSPLYSLVAGDQSFKFFGCRCFNLWFFSSPLHSLVAGLSTRLQGVTYANLAIRYALFYNISVWGDCWLTGKTPVKVKTEADSASIRETRKKYLNWRKTRLSVKYSTLGRPSSLLGVSTHFLGVM